MLVNLRACEDYDRECLDILECTRKKEFADDYVPSFLQEHVPKENFDTRNTRGVLRGTVQSSDSCESGSTKDKKGRYVENKSTVCMESSKAGGDARTHSNGDRESIHEEPSKSNKNLSNITEKLLHENKEEPGMVDTPERKVTGIGEGREEERKDRRATTFANISA